MKKILNLTSNQENVFWNNDEIPFFISILKVEK